MSRSLCVPSGICSRLQASWYKRLVCTTTGTKTKELRRALSSLEQRRQIFDNLPLDPLHAEWFRHRAWIRTIHGTTRIEGNSLNALEVEDVLLNAAPAVSRKDALEVLATQEALGFVDEIAPDRKVALDERLVRHVHQL